MNGIVIKSTGSWYMVRSNDGDLYRCRLKGKFRTRNINSTNPIVVGDRVMLEKADDIFMIKELFERKNSIIRRSVNLARKTHIIAANIEQAILMITLDSPVTTTGFIDRFLVAACAYDVEVILLFNKQDIYNDSLLYRSKELQEIYKRVGYKSLSMSILQDDLDDLASIMKGKVNMIAGHSGVGKSTLINKLQPNLDVRTQEISAAHNQGKHTTTFSELYDLDFGGCIIDTPGIKGFGLVDMSRSEISLYFPEFIKLRSSCKFHNCLHVDEPYCAVKDMLDQKKIAQSRYDNYLDMMQEDQGSSYRFNNY